MRILNVQLFRNFLVVLIAVLSFSNFGSSQDLDMILKKLNSRYSSAEKIEYSTKYELYKGHKGNEVHSSYEGYVYREKNQMYQRIDAAEFIYGNDFFIQLNTDEKIMVLGLKSKVFDLEVNLNDVLKLCKSKSVTEFNSYYSMTFTFRMESDIPVNVIKMRINKSTFDLERLDLYYSDYQDFSTKPNEVEMEQSHLKITFSNVNHNPEKKDYLFSFKRYLDTNKNIHTPTLLYKGFTLIDERV